MGMDAKRCSITPFSPVDADYYFSGKWDANYQSVDSKWKTE